MKKSLLLLVVLWIAVWPLHSTELTEFLKRQSNVSSVETIPSHSFFKEAVEIMLTQPVDHSNLQKGSFQQRIFIALLEKEAPVVLINEGYAAAYGKSPRYINELCQLLNASQVVVEHRYFGASVPEPLNWDYLTVENAAADHHAVVQLLKPFFTGEWVNTGISKGGQTALLHRLFYPEDVDLTISYVAPMNYAVEDGRHEPWIAKVSGTKEGRAKVLAFQREVLKRREALMPMFDRFVTDKKLNFRTGINEVFDMTVLEYSFSFWQWGNNPDIIPASSAPDSTIFNHWFKIITPDYFSVEEFKNTGSFFVQAARQLGYYGYDTRPFKKLLTVKSTKHYLQKYFLPEDYRPVFDPASAVNTQRFLNTTQEPMIFIYGSDDPWTASGVVIPAQSSILKIVQKGGSHRTRISSLDEQNRQLVMDKIRENIGVKEPVGAM